MPAAVEVILLERVEKLGNLGDIVRVKPGYARNFLLPRNKALRATKDNKSYFEAQRKAIEQQNEDRKKAAEKETGSIDGVIVSIIRHAAEAGQLYGSVSAKDIAEAVKEKTGTAVNKNQVVLNQTFKTIGLFPVTIELHPEIRPEVTINIARTAEEAKIQEETGQALIAGVEEEEEEAPVESFEESSAVTEEPELAKEELSSEELKDEETD